MTLDEYLSQPGMKASDFASRVGLTEASISRIRRGEQNIRRSVMRDIIDASGGVVTAEGLVLDHANEDVAQSSVTTGGIVNDLTAPAGVPA